MSTSGPPIESGSSLSWEGDKMFNIYIYDYCHKRGFKKTAVALLAEADIPADSTPPINARQGLLFEWWSVFWVLFTAKANGQGPEDAMIYTQHQAAQAANKARQQHANQPMRNGQPFPPRPQPMNVSNTPPNFGQVRPQPVARQNGPPFQQDAQNNGRPPYNRPPSRAGTPAAIMSSPSMMNRQPITDINSELQKIPQSQLLQLKQEIGLENKDLPSLTIEEKQRLISLFRQRVTRQKPPNATPGPSMQPQPIRNPNPAVRSVKRNSTSPGDDHEPPQAGSSPKRMRRSPMEQPQNLNPTNPMPMSYPQIPPGQPQPPHMVRMAPPQNGFNPGMHPGPPMMNTMQMGMPGQPPLGSAPVLSAMGGLPNHQPGMMTQMQMHTMQNRGGGPGGGPGSDPSNNPQQYRQPPHMQVMHPGPPPPGHHPSGMQGGRPGMMHPPPGPSAGSPESGGFNPGGPHPPPQFAGGPPGPRMGGPPGPPMGMVPGQHKPMGMLPPPPPSPGMKDGQGGMVGMGVGVMSQHTGGGMPQQGQQSHPPKDGLGVGPGPGGLGGMKPDGSPRNPTLGGGTPTASAMSAPPTPQGGQPPQPQSQQQQQQQQQQQGQPPQQSMSAPPQMGNPMGNPNFGMNPMNAGMNPTMNPMNVPGGMDSSLLNPTEMFFNHDFINSVASSLDDLDTTVMFRNGDDINFERDFGQWFSPDGIAGSLDMK